MSKTAWHCSSTRSIASSRAGNSSAGGACEAASAAAPGASSAPAAAPPSAKAPARRSTPCATCATATTRAIADRFHDCLAEGGYLIVGHSERREIFAAKRAVLRAAFDELGHETVGSEAGIYIWVRVGDDLAAAAALLVLTTDRAPVPVAAKIGKR